MDLILASQSPRRRELLSRLGLEFTVRTAEHDETMDPAAAPFDEVARVSRLKAYAVQALCPADELILAADTVVVCDGQILGKPRSAADAERMLRLLSDRAHQVMTGLTLLRGERCRSTTVVTDLRFRALSDGEIAAYVASGEPMDKAGAYGIQGLASIFVSELHGDYYNVMGLPLCTLAQLLRGFGVKLLGE